MKSEIRNNWLMNFSKHIVKGTYIVLRWHMDGKLSYVQLKSSNGNSPSWHVLKCQKENQMLQRKETKCCTNLGVQDVHSTLVALTHHISSFLAIPGYAILVRAYAPNRGSEQSLNRYFVGLCTLC